MSTRALADGNEIPLLGLGVWQVPEGPECVSAVRAALELGYRHIDTAQAYENEESVGIALRESGLPREDIFVTTKFFPAQVDLYIIHWPQGGPTWAWPGMEAAKERGYARSIGVSNFTVDDLQQLLPEASVPPVLNQVNFNPFAYRRALLAFCEENGIVLEAYSPLGTGRHLDNDVVTEIADSLGRTPAQVLIRWCVQRNIPVIPKSTHRERIEENGNVFDFELSADDLARLDELDQTGGTGDAVDRKWW
jgi:2,5-diketo-D-gluconate reductase A